MRLETQDLAHTLSSRKDVTPSPSEFQDAKLPSQEAAMNQETGQYTSKGAGDNPATRRKAGRALEK